jgi:hypothetical protein
VGADDDGDVVEAKNGGGYRDGAGAASGDAPEAVADSGTGDEGSEGEDESADEFEDRLDAREDAREDREDALEDALDNREDAADDNSGSGSDD